VKCSLRALSARRIRDGLPARRHPPVFLLVYSLNECIVDRYYYSLSLIGLRDLIMPPWLSSLAEAEGARLLFADRVVFSVGRTLLLASCCRLTLGLAFLNGEQSHT